MHTWSHNIRNSSSSASHTSVAAISHVALARVCPATATDTGAILWAAASEAVGSSDTGEVAVTADTDDGADDAGEVASTDDTGALAGTDDTIRSASLISC